MSFGDGSVDFGVMRLDSECLLKQPLTLSRSPRVNQEAAKLAQEHGFVRMSFEAHLE